MILHQYSAVSPNSHGKPVKQYWRWWDTYHFFIKCLYWQLLFLELVCRVDNIPVEVNKDVSQKTTCNLNKAKKKYVIDLQHGKLPRGGFSCLSSLQVIVLLEGRGPESESLFNDFR